jgi:hypothetical protein
MVMLSDAGDSLNPDTPAVVAQAGSCSQTRLAILLLSPDAATDDAPPGFTECGTIPLSANHVALPDELLLIHLRNDQGEHHWEALGVMRGVLAKPDGMVGFSRYEAFTTPLRIGAPSSQIAVDGQFALARWPQATIDGVMSSAGKQWASAGRAREFAQYLAWAFTGTALLRRSAARALREHAPAHHLFHRQVKFWLSEFLGEHENEPIGFQIDTDGLLREGTTRARYTLLGSYVQPATSIVSPFRCAVDYTVQTDPTTGFEIKQGLLESWAHVASASYDAAVRVVILRADTPYEIHSYLSLRHIGTRNLLDRLKHAGVFLALLGSAADEDS